jgi:hypothetical protein
LRSCGGTISEKMGLLQAGADQLFTSPNSRKVSAWAATDEDAPWVGSPYIQGSNLAPFSYRCDNLYFLRGINFNNWKI